MSGTWWRVFHNPIAGASTRSRSRLVPDTPQSIPQAGAQGLQITCAIAQIMREAPVRLAQVVIRQAGEEMMSDMVAQPHRRP